MRYEGKFDVTFASDNDFGVPTLDLSLQARLLPAPFLAWGSVARTNRMPGCYHFFVDDSKFSALWKQPLRLVESGCRAVVEPNFSTSDQLPLARILWDIYRKRWLARFWQAHGLPIVVDLNVAPRAAEANLLGVPRGWTAFATRYQAVSGAALSRQQNSLAALDEQARTAEKHANTAISLVVYSGGPAVAEHCRQRGWQHFPNQAERLRIET
ncbi:MAG: DUF4417 domain-containing protein [Pirellulales bacterium]